MNITISGVEIGPVAKEVKFALEATVKFQEMDGYRFAEILSDRVSRVVADKYLDLHMDEVLKLVDIETIVRKVQMMVIQDLARK